jgi:hypothetical protein
MEDLPFDCILVEDGAAPRRLDVEQFVALSLTERVRLLLEGKVRFLKSEQPVNNKRCLQALMQRSSARMVTPRR